MKLLLSIALAVLAAVAVNCILCSVIPIEQDLIKFEELKEPDEILEEEFNVEEFEEFQSIAAV